MRDRFLSGLLAAAFLAAMLPTAAFAEGEVDFAAAPAQEEQAVQADTPATPESAAPVGEDEAPTPAPDAAAQAVQSLQEKINALPTAEEIAGYDEEEKAPVADAIDAIAVALEALSADEQAALDKTKYDAAFAALYGGGFTAEELALMQVEDPAELSLVDQLRQRQLLAAYDEAQGVATLALGDNTDPYRISNAAQLAELATLVNANNGDFTGANYKLVADIDLSTVCGEGEGKGNWTPIGDYYMRIAFTGTFDGASHTISNLYINNDGADSQGLFGYVKSGTIKNLGVVNAYINASSHAGAVVAEAMYHATVENCYSTGTVTAINNVGGGVVGFAADTTVQNCYSTAAVTGNKFVGGVVGCTGAAAIKNCCSTGTVAGDEKVGGVVGNLDMDSNTVQNCVALNPGVSGRSDFAAVVGVDYAEDSNITNNYYWNTLPTDATSDALTYDATNGLSKQFDEIFGNDGAWEYSTDGLPVLAGFAEGSQTSTLPLYITNPESADNIYIDSAAKLVDFANDVNTNRNDYNGKTVYLTADIDLASVCSADKGSWTPIGTDNGPFTGTFDGQGHTISGLYIGDDCTATDLGLFGYVASASPKESATIKNVGVVNININNTSSSEFRDVGGVVGNLYASTVENCFTTGTISGMSGVGGVVGWARSDSSDWNGCIVQNCYSTANVSGLNIVGGVVGNLYYGLDIDKSHTTVRNCYSTGTISGGSPAGGVAGYVNGGTLQNCIALNQSVSGSYNSVGAVLGQVVMEPVYSGNGYWDKMSVKQGSTEVAEKDSTGATKLTYDTTNGLSQQFSAFFGADNAAWEFTDNGLPTLKGFSDPQDSSIPSYMVENNTTVAIYTAEDLKAVAEFVKKGRTYIGETILLMNDIDLSTVCGPKAGGASWTPIGTYNNGGGPAFAGTFDGQGHTISGLYINDATQNRSCGLFGYVVDFSAVVKNVGVVGVNITATGYNAYAGGVAGFVANSANIQNCYSTGTVSATNSGGMAGGVAGYVKNGSAVKNCYSTAAVSGSLVAGGIAGYIENSAVINCVALNTGVGGGAVVGSIISGGTTTGNAYWAGIGAGDSTGATVLTQKGGILYTDTTHKFDWSTVGIGADTGWTVPTDALLLPYFTASKDRPSMTLASSKAVALAIDYTTASLYGAEPGARYQVTYTVGTVGNTIGVDADKQGAILIQDAWFGKTITVEKGSATQSIDIPTRKEAPTVAPTATATSGTVKVTNLVDVQEYAMRPTKDTDSPYTGWQTGDTFTHKGTGEIYTVATRTKGDQSTKTFPSAYRESAACPTPVMVKYQAPNADGTFSTVEREAYPVTSESTTLGAGWYVVRQRAESPTIQDRIKVNGDVNLILEDDATLTAYNGFNVIGGSLSIYGQTAGTGTLTASDISTYVYQVVIYGGKVRVSFTIAGGITIRGGTVQANTIFGGKAVVINGDTVVSTDKFAGVEGYTPTKGIVFDGTDSGTTNTGYAYGDVTLTQPMADAIAGHTVTVKMGANLTVPTGVTLDSSTTINYEVYKYDDNGFRLADQFTTDTTRPTAENGMDTDYAKLYQYIIPNGNDYAITKPGQMYWFAAYANDNHLSINGKLMNDVDLQAGLGDDVADESKRKWTPIGKNYGSSYSGNFNGGGHEVQNLYININSADRNGENAGLFGMNTGTIEMLGVTGKVTNNSNFASCTGGICGLNSGTIQNCYNKADVTGGGYGVNYTGGICGAAGRTKYCYNDATVKGPANHTGALFGCDGSTTYSCYNKSDNSTVIVVGDGSRYEDCENLTVADFASGKAAYLLNHGESMGNSQNVWRQNLTGDVKDEMPTLDAAHSTVYGRTAFTIDKDGKGTESVAGYQNTAPIVYRPAFEQNSATPSSITIALTEPSDESHGTVYYGIIFSGAEDYATWQTTPTFTNLVANEAYVFFVRTGGTDSCSASAIRNSQVFSTAPATYTVSIPTKVTAGSTNAFHITATSLDLGKGGKVKVSLTPKDGNTFEGGKLTLTGTNTATNATVQSQLYQKGTGDAADTPVTEPTGLAQFEFGKDPTGGTDYYFAAPETADAPAGDYTGTVSFLVEYTKGTEW